MLSYKFTISTGELAAIMLFFALFGGGSAFIIGRDEGRKESAKDWKCVMVPNSAMDGMESGRR